MSCFFKLFVVFSVGEFVKNELLVIRGEIKDDHSVPVFFISTNAIGFLQILHFLRTRAHPEMLKKVCVKYFVISATLHLMLFGLKHSRDIQMTALATMLDDHGTISPIGQVVDISIF